MSEPDARRVPVIVGVGEVTERVVDLAVASEPIDLMAQALHKANRDANGGWLERADSVDVVAEYSWPYEDAPALLCARSGMHPRRKAYGDVGGETPIRYLHEAALRIARGESSVGFVVGAEAAYTVARATKAGVDLAWTPRAPVRLKRGADMVGELATRYGADKPIHAYPLYENAYQAQCGQTPASALAQIGTIWAAASSIAMGNANAWSQQAWTAHDIATPSPANRRVAWPYTKLMVANPLVNMGAAVIVASLHAAREAGLPADRLIYVGDGAAASEPDDLLGRDSYAHSTAQIAVLDALQHAAGAAAGFDELELYSCFPCVPKMALHALGLPWHTRFTGIGSLSFFGAPLNNYMGHATVGMVRALRERARRKLGGRGLLYGQGGFFTKHHALILATDMPACALRHDYSVQAQADRLRGEVPCTTTAYRGAASLETFTVVYAHEGEVAYGIAIVRTEAGARTMARIPQHACSVLTDGARNPIGCNGRLAVDAEGINVWEFAP